MARRLPIKIYDCFSSRRFGGNVGAVVYDCEQLTTQEMQSLAGEINAPVSGFVTTNDANALSVRFFMPKGEIAMCGHVTIGLFSDLSEDNGLNEGSTDGFLMETQAGGIHVQASKNSGGRTLVMLNMPLPENVELEPDREAIAEALGVGLSDISEDIPIGAGSTGLKHLFVPMKSLQSLQSMAPDFEQLETLSRSLDIATVMPFSTVTENPSNDIHCRDFCPAVGVNEVPASGTTNSALAGYLVASGLIETKPDGVTTVLAEQGLEMGRPSLIRSDVTLRDGAPVTLEVGGHAVLVVDGHIHV